MPRPGGRTLNRQLIVGNLHIVPGDSAAGSLRQAIRASGRADEVLAFRDDLSCGPIDSDDPAVRADWWRRFFYDAEEVTSHLGPFWNRVATTDQQMVVWVSRHCAQEFAFFLSFVDRLGDRRYDVVDVTGLEWPYTRPDGSAGV